MYIEINDKCVQRLSDSAFIPRDLNSNAYKAYLKWKQEQDTNQSADNAEKGEN